MNYAKLAYNKAKTLNYRDEELENIIMTDPFYCYRYALNILCDRWPQAEPVIMTEPYYSSMYAIDVIKGRWEDAEHVIMTDPESSYWYSYEILNHQWEEAEEYMVGDTEYEDEYVCAFYGGEKLSNVRMRRDLEKMCCF